MKLIDALNALATDIAESVKGQTVDFKDKVDALKALTALYATLHRAKTKSDDDLPEGGTMSDFRRMIEGADGTTSIRDRQGTRPS